MIPDMFQAPIADIVAELNAQRTEVAGLAPLASRPVVQEFCVADFRFPWLTLSLLGALLVVFAAELAFPVGHLVKPLEPSLPTLIAFGGLNRTVIFATGE